MITPRFQPLASLPEHVHELLLRLPQFRQHATRRIVPLRMRQRAAATVYQFQVRSPSERDEYWVKVHKSGCGRARKEFDLLNALRQCLKEVDNANGVEPVACFDEHDVLITRHAEGIHLSRLIAPFNLTFRWRSAADRGRNACYVAGICLGRLHQADALSPSPDDRSHAYNAVTEILARPERGWQVPPEVRLQTEKAMQSLFEQVDDVDLIRVRSHGDYGTHNILVEAERLAILDPSFTFDGIDVENRHSRFHDLTRFWSTLHGNTRMSLCSARRGELLCVFLAGYNDATGLGITASHPAFEMFALRHLVMSLRDWPGRTGRVLPAMRTATLCWWLRRHDGGRRSPD